MRRAVGKDLLPGKKGSAVAELRRGELETAALDLRHVDAQHGQIGPVIPANQFGADPLKVREREVDFDRPPARHMGVGQHDAIRGHYDAGPEAGRVPSRPCLKRQFPHIDFNHRLEQPVETPAHGGGRGRNRQEGKGKKEDERGG